MRSNVRFWPTLIFVVLFATLLGLGFWQVQRLAWKENLIATIAARMQEDPLDVTAIPPDKIDYHPATATGTFQNDKTIYIHAIERDTGTGGYHVITAMLLSSGKTLLVDRGFIPFEKRASAEYTKPTHPLFIRGISRVPNHPLMQPENNPATGDYYWVDIPALTAQFNLNEVLPFVLAADKGPNPDRDSMVLPHGGQTQMEIPNDHFGYAVTWFSLAGALAIIYGIWLRRKVS